MGSRRKRLKGRLPRRRVRLQEGQRRRERAHAAGLLLVLATGFFVVGIVVGFGWAMDRQLRGGILRQHTEAVRRPDWVELERLPGYVPAALVAVVDPAFLESGALRTGEAGTTLARVLVRQVHLLPAGVAGEARELLMGPVLEQRLSKEALLELFLNRVYLGEAQGYRIYGIYHAAHEYFGKEPHELTLGEAATLAGLLLPPRITNPESHVGAVGVRRNEVLRVMLTGELITPEQYRAAVAEPLGFQPGLERLPMTRPVDWGREAPPIRLPESLRPRPDSVAAQPEA